MKIPTEREINDLSKADAFTKAFACIQSSWLIIQSIVRVSLGLPITQLELATMAFIVCALTMYLLWWHKPFGVESRAYLTVIAHSDSDKETLAIRLSESYSLRSSLSANYSSFLYFREILGVPSRGVSIEKDSDDRVRTHLAQEDREFCEADMTFGYFIRIFLDGFADISGNHLVKLGKALWAMVRNVFGNSDFAEPHREQTRTLVLYATGMLFSALHLVAWNWEFPSPTVRVLWRVFAIIATSTGPVTILFVSALLALNSFVDDIPEFVVMFPTYFLVFVYSVSRIGLVVLIFYCFSSMPAGVYKTVNWLQFLPHFS